MSQHVVVVIRDDPFQSPRAVEALRIALGLAAGEAALTVVLFDKAISLLSDERDDIVDVEILEKYLPSFKHLEIPFVFPLGMRGTVTLEEGFSVREQSVEDIRQLCRTADRLLVF